MIIPSSSDFDQSTLTALLEYDPVVQDYRTFFALLDWSAVEWWQAQQSSYCGTHGHPISAYLKAFLIRIREKMIYATELRTFLLHHPLLILDLGFSLHLDPTTPYGFDAEKTCPAAQPFNEGDVTYYRPLYQQAVVALEQFPTHVTADAAYDAWYVYETAARHGGIGAIPLNQHSKTIFDLDMVPLCPIGLRMHPVFDYAHTMAIVLDAIAVRFSFPPQLANPAHTLSSSKAKDARKRSILSVEDKCASL